MRETGNPGVRARYCRATLGQLFELPCDFDAERMRCSHLRIMIVQLRIEGGTKVARVRFVPFMGRGRIDLDQAADRYR